MSDQMKLGGGRSGASARLVKGISGLLTRSVGAGIAANAIAIA
jgi:hypothetical protein